MSHLAKLPKHGAGLAAGQWAMLAQIRRTSDAETATSRGMQVYRANARIGAALALGAAYPVLAQLLGEESFEAMARHFWHTQPPTQGDWAQWGADLPPFLATSAQLADMPYLPDVARLEWALHLCAGEADAAQDPASFALLAQHAPEQVYLQLGAACLVASAYPVLRIVQAHNADSTDLAELAALAPLLSGGAAETVLVWRKGFVPQMRAVQGAELAFTTVLLAGKSLGNALDAAGDGLDFSAWLAHCFQSGLVLGASLHSNNASH
jgi:Putative DNA-binding domain